METKLVDVSQLLSDAAIALLFDKLWNHLRAKEPLLEITEDLARLLEKWKLCLARGESLTGNRGNGPRYAVRLAVGQLPERSICGFDLFMAYMVIRQLVPRDSCDGLQLELPDAIDIMANMEPRRARLARVSEQFIKVTKRGERILGLTGRISK